jgi:hypothetical protein
MPRRRLLKCTGALSLAAILRPTLAFGELDDDDDRLGPFGPWSTPVNLGPVVNTQYLESHPAISKNGLSLYITSNRPGGVNGQTFTGFNEIWVSQRDSVDAPWNAPVNLDAFNSVPVINSVGLGTAVPSFSADGHLLFFSIEGPGRPGGLGGSDLYVSRRTNKHDDFGWQEPVNLGVINSPQDDTALTYFEDEETGIISGYVTTTRPGGPPGSGPNSFHIWSSTLGDDGSFGPAVLVPELSSQYNDTRTAIRRDGLEFFLSSDRPNGRIGTNDIWVSTRDSTDDPWSTPVNLGSTVNYPRHITGAPALSWDGTTLYFYSTDRPGGFGGRDLYVATRRKLREHERHDDPDHQRS